MKLYERVISDFGGYEKCKDILSQPNIGFIMNVEALRRHMLEYRRQHSIFEVGDLVVKTHPKNTILWPVLGVYKNGGVWLDYKGFCWKPPSVRHATDEEIKAGKRLEVNQ